MKPTSPFATMLAKPLTGCLATSALLLHPTVHANETGGRGAENPARPNIVLIITDDVERSMMNALPEGQGRNLTPNLDRLILEGVLMSGQHVASAVCTPSRYNVLTGRYASRALKVEPDEQAVVAFTTHIGPDEITLPGLLQQAGYRTGMAGKNHVIKALPLPDIAAEADPRDPAVAAALRKFQPRYEEALQRAGFDFAGGIYPANPDELLPRALRIHNMDFVAEGALRFLDAQTPDTPFFLYFATTLPHGPVQAERSWNSDPLLTPFGVLDQPLDVLPPRASIPTRLAAANLKSPGPEGRADPAEGQGPAMMLAIDDAIGALLERLKERGLLENTIIVFFNDHGCDAKGTLYQGGLAFPSVVWREGGFPVGSRSGALVSNVDFAPTLLDLAGVSFERGQFDGSSFRGVLMGDPPAEDRVLYAEMGFSRAVRRGDWKYLALRYPEDVAGMPLEERRQRLEEWNAHLRERGITPVTTDPAAPFSHLTAIPGGAHAEHSSTGGTAHYYDADQLFNLAADPGETRNLAADPAYAEQLAAMQELLRQEVQKLPGIFGEFTPPSFID
jgi:arylsulfatase A